MTSHENNLKFFRRSEDDVLDPQTPTPPGGGS